MERGILIARIRHPINYYTSALLRAALAACRAVLRRQQRAGEAAGEKEKERIASWWISETRVKHAK